MWGRTAVLMLSHRGSPPKSAFARLPLAYPALSRGQVSKTPRSVRFIQLISLGKLGADDGIHTLDSNLGVDLHSNLRLAPIWVERGTKIETGASFSLNLSANFAALSGESDLLFDCGLPGFDDGDCRNKFLSTAARRLISGNGGSFGSTKPDDIASRYSRSTGRSIPF
jgi:hypothetical protein